MDNGQRIKNLDQIAVEIVVVVRHVGERTLPLCLDALRKTGLRFIVINKTPFIKAVAEMWKIGTQSEAPFLLGLDADVILTDNALADIDKALTIYRSQMTTIGRIDFSVQDKFRGRIRAGCHLYNNHYAQTFFRFFRNLSYNPRSFRPERDNNLIIMETMRLKKISWRKTTIGKHDFEQYYRHLFVKYSNIAVKSSPERLKLFLHLIASMKEKNPEDYDYFFALEGLSRGLRKKEMITDAKLYPSIEGLLKKLGIGEKPPLN